MRLRRRRILRQHRSLGWVFLCHCVVAVPFLLQDLTRGRQPNWWVWLPILGVLLACAEAIRWIPAVRSRLQRVKWALPPPCYCPRCGEMVATVLHRPECKDEPSPWASHWRCPGCAVECRGREEARWRGLLYRCANGHRHEFPDFPPRHPVHKSLYPTWVIGTLLPVDFRVWERQRGAVEQEVLGVRLLYVPPRSGSEIALCVLDLSALPETGMLPPEHPLAALQAVWIGADATPLEVAGGLDRFQRATGFSLWERKQLVMMVEAVELDPHLLKRLSGRLGELSYGVTVRQLQERLAIRATRPTQHEPAAPSDGEPVWVPQEVRAGEGREA